MQLAACGQRVLDVEPHDLSASVEHIGSRKSAAADLCKGFPVSIEQVRKRGTGFLDGYLCIFVRFIDLHSDNCYPLIAKRLDDIRADIGELLFRHAAVTL